MKGLMRKEWYLLTGSGLAFLIMTLGFAVVGGVSGITGPVHDVDLSFPGIFALVYVPLCTYSMYGAEEKWRCSNYFLCAPVSRFQVVLAKYWMNTLHMLVVTVIYGGLNLAICRGAAIPQLISALTAALLAGATGLPLMFWLGSEKGRAWVMILTMCVAITLGMVLNMNDTVSQYMSDKLAYILIPLVCLGLYILSCPLAAWLYGRRRK